MKKSLILLFVLIFSANSAFALFGSKNNTDDTEGKGYLGTLPNLTKEHEPNEPSEGAPVFDKTKQFHSVNELRPIPRDDTSFVNIILKPDKTSQYITDLNEFILMLEKLYDSIYFFNKNADYFRDKYANKPESFFISYQKLLELSLRAKTVSNLRTEAEKYKPYLAYSGNGKIYNSANIDQQLDYLKKEIESVIVVLKEAE